VRLSLRRSEVSTTYRFSRKEIRAMVELCQRIPKLRWLGDVIIALATTGVRIGELAGLRWTDVDLATGMITLPDNRHSGRHQKAGAVRKTKGRRTRRVPIHSRLRPVLKGLARRADGRVFSGPGGSVLRPNSVCKIFIREVVGPLKATFPRPRAKWGSRTAACTRSGTRSSASRLSTGRARAKSASGSGTPTPASSSAIAI
jgi:integrase